MVGRAVQRIWVVVQRVAIGVGGGVPLQQLELPGELLGEVRGGVREGQQAREGQDYPDIGRVYRGDVRGRHAQWLGQILQTERRLYRGQVLKQHPGRTQKLKLIHQTNPYNLILPPTHQQSIRDLIIDAIFLIPALSLPYTSFYLLVTF